MCIFSLFELNLENLFLTLLKHYKVGVLRDFCVFVLQWEKKAIRNDCWNFKLWVFWSQNGRFVTVNWFQKLFSPRSCKVDLGWGVFLFWPGAGEFWENCWRISQQILMAKFFPRSFRRCFWRVSGHPRKFTPKLVGIPLKFHFLEPKTFSRRFSAYWGDQILVFWNPIFIVFWGCTLFGPSCYKRVFWQKRQTILIDNWKAHFLVCFGLSYFSF